MKNNNEQRIQIHVARHSAVHAVRIDVLVNPQIVEQNNAKLSQRHKRKRRINYEKKILNDPFIFSI